MLHGTRLSVAPAVVCWIGWMCWIGAPRASASLTGSVIGVVTDAQLATVPGATIEVSSPVLQGRKVAVSGADGAYRFILLPPGEYRLSASLSGFATSVRTGVRVGIDETVRVDFSLSPAASAELTVTEQTPLIQQRSTTIGANFSEELFDSLPLTRDYTSIVALTPGVSSDSAGLTFYGSSGAENRFVIDGVDTTNIGFGTQGKSLNFDFIKEVEVKSGGYEAEYGRSTGGIINVITKNGGNSYHGDGFGYWQSSRLEADPCKSCGTPYGTGEGFSQGDLGGDLGGYALTDKLWFFAAFNPTINISHTRAPVGSLIPRSGQLVETGYDTRYYLAGKLTWNLNAENNVVLSTFGDPERILNKRTRGDDATDARYSRGGTDWTAKLNSILNPSLFLDFQVARHHERRDLAPGNGDRSTPQFCDDATGACRRAVGSFFTVSRTRPSARATFTAMTGEHEIKFGADFQHNSYLDTSGVSGGAAYTVHAHSVERFSYFRFDSHGSPVLLDAQIANTATTDLSLFVQDRWNLRPNLVVSPGLRWDRQSIRDRDGIARITLWKEFAPRLGVTWDPGGRGLWKVYASAGRFYESIPLDLNDRSLGAEGDAILFYDRATAGSTPAFGPSDLGRLRASYYLGGTVTPVVPDLKAQYLDELIAGVDVEVRPKLKLGIKALYREIGDVVEDMSVDDGAHYFIGNPGQGDAREGLLPDGTIVRFPLPRRIYRGVEITVDRRLSRGWQLFGSYVYGKLVGNYEGEAAAGQLDPNITAAFDLPSLLPNRYGPLPLDQRHVVKIEASYELPFRLQLGASFKFASGLPVNTLGAHPVYGGGQAFILPRGEVFSQQILDGLWHDPAHPVLDPSTGAAVPEPRSRDRGTGLFSFDLNAHYPLRLGHAALHLYLYVYNLFNFQRAGAFNSTFTSDSVDVTALLRSGATREQIARRYTLNPYYLAPTSFQSPRQARIGAKLSF